MSTLILISQPGFTEVPDSAFDAGNVVTAANMKAVNAAAKFAAVRTEEFWGFYGHGESVQLPVSPADGYAYSREELFYSWSIYATSAPPGGGLNGTQTPPTPGANGGAGNLLGHGGYVDQATGAVSCWSSYYVQNGAQTNTTDGILLVITHAKRAR
jgi:hypothetical protein